MWIDPCPSRNNKVYGKAVNRVHLLQPVRQKLTKQEAESIYKSMIQLLITYLDLILLWLLTSNINKLKRLQGRLETCAYGDLLRVNGHLCYRKDKEKQHCLQTNV